MKNNNYKTITVKMNKKGVRSNVDKIYLFLGDIGDKFNLHIRNVEFGDGYFIFNIGKNKVCHFEIKECKKWMFGIWLEGSDDKDKYIQIFAQPKNNIDKFKPSHSYYSVSLSKEDLNNNKYDELKNMIYEIKKHPYIAWCMDCGLENEVGYNYLSGIKAFIKVSKFNINNIIQKTKSFFIKFKIFNYLKIMKMINRIHCYAIVSNHPDENINIDPEYKIYIISKIKYADKIDEYLTKLRDKDYDILNFNHGYEIETYDDAPIDDDATKTDADGKRYIYNPSIDNFNKEYSNKKAYKQYKKNCYYAINPSFTYKKWVWEEMK